MKKFVLIGVLVITMIFSQSMAYADSLKLSGKNILGFTKVAANSLASSPLAPVNVMQPMSGVNLNSLRNGLRGDYFSGKNFEKLDTFSIDNEINFNWGSCKTPILGLGHDNFSIRWTGFLVPKYNEAYTFTTKADDGVRFYINGQLLINDWNEHGEKDNQTTVILTANQPYSITLEYFQNNGPASVKLYWASISQRKEIIPEKRFFTPVTPAPEKGSGTGLLGSYYDGANFDIFKSTKVDSTINYQMDIKNQKIHSPFSVRWEGRIEPFYSEVYTFRTTSDDGVRVWINGQKIIDRWYEGSSSESIGTIQLQAGQLYDIKVEYFDNNSWPAVCRLYWSSISQQLQLLPKSQLYLPQVVPAPVGNGNGLKAEYYSDKQLSVLKAVKVDSDINFDWGNRGLPADGISHDNFSVRWSGKIQPLYTENYTFKTVSDDGIRLWVNGVQLVNEWNTHSAKTNTASAQLQAGQMYDIRIEYYQETGFARSELYWYSKSQKLEIVPQRQLYSN